jgi:hypothetical protein
MKIYWRRLWCCILRVGQSPEDDEKHKGEDLIKGRGYLR